MTVRHITLTNGDFLRFETERVSPAALRVCQRLLPRGAEIPGPGGFRVVLTGALWTVFQGLVPLCTSGMGEGPDDTWRELTRLSDRFPTDRSGPRIPCAVPGDPWLATVMLPAATAGEPEHTGWLPDFNRAMACAIMNDPYAGG